uniref:Uncharacterized protein n=1 Tax=Arundo donax TaxID=35708 RepID=A0A0A8ZM92_ARUDO
MHIKIHMFSEVLHFSVIDPMIDSHLLSSFPESPPCMHTSTKLVDPILWVKMVGDEHISAVD